jgi:hypothetical protein
LVVLPIRRQAGQVAMLAAFAALAAACSGEGASVFRSPETTAAAPLGTSSTVADATTTVTTHAGASTTAEPSTSVASTSATTVVETTTTTAESLPVIDEALMDSVPAAELPGGPEALMSGAPDEASAAALRAELQGSDVDLTGVDVWVWPVSGTGDVLLVIEGDDRASAFVDDPQASDAVLRQLVESEVLDTAGVTRVVINYRGADEQGAFTFTVTMRLEVIRRSLSEGTDIPQEELLFEFTRGV